MNIAELTSGQVERELSQQIQALYKEKLGHSPRKVSCEFLDHKIVVLIEGSLTLPEQLLTEEGQHEELVETIRDRLSEILIPYLKTLVSDVVEIEVIDTLSDDTLNTERTAIIFILSEKPSFRPNRAAAKVSAG